MSVVALSGPADLRSVDHKVGSVDVEPLDGRLKQLRVMNRAFFQEVKHLKHLSNTSSC